MSTPGSGMSEAQMELLMSSLQVAVPMRIDQQQRNQITDQYRQQLVEQIGVYGDVLMFGAKPRNTNKQGFAGEQHRKAITTPGTAAETFNALSKALGVLAVQTGGVTFCGLHWCTEHQLALTIPEGEAPPCWPPPQHEQTDTGDPR